MDRWKAEMGRGREKRRVEESRSEKRKSQKKKDADSRKGRKSRDPLCFSYDLWLRRGRKVGSLKRRVRSQLARGEMKNCTPLWREAHFHFWKLRCRKRACRCGAKHICKSKCTKHTRFGPLLEVEMLKKCTPLSREAHFEFKCTKHTSSGPLLEVEMSRKCTPLWREARFEVKMYKTHQLGPLLEVETSKKCTFWSQKCKKLTGTEHFWMLRCAFAWQAQGIVDLVKSEENVRVLWHFQKRWQAWGIWRGSGCIFRGRRSTETCSSELLGGPGADFLRRVAFWSIRSSGLLRLFCVTGAALRMTWYHFLVAGAVV